MNPNEVPAELVEKAWEHFMPGVDLFGQDLYWMGQALAAVLPEIQAQALRDAAKDAQASGLPFRFSQAEFLEGRAARLTATTEEPTT